MKSTSKLFAWLLILCMMLTLCVLAAAEGSGADIYRVNSASYETFGKRRSIYSVVLKTEGGDFTSMLTYLILSGLDVTVVGIYKNLE